MRVHQQPAFVLINRAYSESSLIVELFSKDYGRLSVLSKGARRAKSRLKGVLQPLQPLLCSWSGKGEVPTLTQAEIHGQVINLRADTRICGFYCNELLMYLTHRNDPHPKLFDEYSQLLGRLHDSQYTNGDGSVHAELRDFEKALIREIGYEINFLKEANSNIDIDGEAQYVFVPGSGFRRASHKERVISVRGDAIRALAGKQNNEADVKASRELMRVILNHLTGNKPINSRALFFPKSAISG